MKLKLISVFLVVCILCCFCVPVSAFNELGNLMEEAQVLDHELEKIGKSAQLANERYDNSTKPVDIAAEKYHTANKSYEDALRMHHATHDESHIGRGDECHVCGRTVSLILDAKQEMKDAEHDYYRAMEDMHKTGTALSREMRAAETCLGKIAEVNGKIANKMSVLHGVTDSEWDIIKTSLQKKKGAVEAKEKLEEQRSFFDECEDYIHNNPEEFLIVAGTSVAVAAGAGIATGTYLTTLLPTLLIKATSNIEFAADLVAICKSGLELMTKDGVKDVVIAEANHALEIAVAKYNAAVAYKAYLTSCITSGAPIITGCLVIVGIILLCLLAYWIYVKFYKKPNGD